MEFQDGGAGGIDDVGRAEVERIKGFVGNDVTGSEVFLSPGFVMGHPCPEAHQNRCHVTYQENQY